MPPPPARMIFAAALAYVATVFAAGFLLGTLRVLIVAPRLGEFRAVALEAPVILLISWIVAGRVLRRWPVAAGGLRALAAMGALAFALLMLAESTLATLAFGQTLPEWFAALATPAGALGLAAQIGFAAIPALRRS